MRIVAIADLHGHLPEIPPCDLLLIGGDICIDGDPLRQAAWLTREFRAWLDSVPAKEVIATWGNHDWVGERGRHLVPRLRWHLLNDEALALDGLKIYGSPWQPRFFDWTFNLDEPELARKWQAIPDDADILVLHGPPLGYGDFNGHEHAGSLSLLERIRQVKPKLAIFGHIHEGRGEWRLEGGTLLANVTILDVQYQMVYPPWEVEIETLRK
jgi:Icc-related predicted phosphoesterase